DAILNYNRRGTRRFDFVVRIGFKDDIGAAMVEIRHLFEQDDRILKDPAPGVWTSELSESSVDLIVRAWTRSDDMWAAKTDLLRAIKDHFDKVGISIPLPQRQLTVVGANCQTRRSKADRAAERPGLAAPPRGCLLHRHRPPVVTRYLVDQLVVRIDAGLRGLAVDGDGDRAVAVLHHLLLQIQRLAILAGAGRGG